MVIWERFSQKCGEKVAQLCGSVFRKWKVGGSNLGSVSFRAQGFELWCECSCDGDKIGMIMATLSSAST